MVDAAGALWRMNAVKDADGTGGRDARGMNEHMVGEWEEIQSLGDCLLDLFVSPSCERCSQDGVSLRLGRVAASAMPL